MKSFVKKGHHEKADLTSEIADEMTGVRCLSFCNQKRLINFISDIIMLLVNIITVILLYIISPTAVGKISGAGAPAKTSAVADGKSATFSVSCKPCEPY